MAEHDTQDGPTVPLALYEELKARHEGLNVEHEEMAAKYGAMSAQNREMSAQLTTMQGILVRVAGRMGVSPRRKGMSEDGKLQVDDFQAVVNEIESGLDATAAAQNGRGVRGDGHDKVWYRMVDLDGLIQDDRALHDFTGVEPIKFEYIAHRVKEYLEAHNLKLYYDVESRSSDPGNRSKLNIRYALFMTLFRKLTNLRPKLVGHIFGVSGSTVKRQSRTMDTVLENVLPTAPTMAKRLQMITDADEFIRFTGGSLMQDGTLTAAHDSKDPDNPETSGFSGKHHQSGFATLVTCTARAMVLDLSKSAPGNQHDMALSRDNPMNFGLWSTVERPKTAAARMVMRIMRLILDKGFIGFGNYFPWVNTWLPHKGKNKKSPKELVAAYKSRDNEAIAAALGLTLDQYIENMKQSSVRSLIERVIGKMKRWEVLAGIFRGTASELNRQFVIISGILNLSVLWPEIERDEHQLLFTLARERAGYRKRR